jgi:outer membrane beta-barrel protein
MRPLKILPAVLAVLAALLLPMAKAAESVQDAGATAANEPKPANEQVVKPELDRRDVQVTHIPSNDFEAGLFTGAYNTENFGASLVGGVRLGYHVTEDVFVEAVYGQTKVSDSTFRDILPGGIFPQPKEILRYYDLSVGYNIFPGEIFLGRTHAKVSAFYVIAGLGTTKFDNTSHQTVNAGAGMRVFLTNWLAVQADLRDHMYSVNLLGTNRDTTNLEATLGATLFF